MAASGGETLGGGEPGPRGPAPGCVRRPPRGCLRPPASSRAVSEDVGAQPPGRPGAAQRERVSRVGLQPPIPGVEDSDSQVKRKQTFRCHHTASGDGSGERVHVPCLPETSKRGNTKAEKSCFNCLRAPEENTPPVHTHARGSSLLPAAVAPEVLHFYFVLLPLVFAVSPLARSWPPAALGCPPGFFPGVSGALAQGRSTQLLSCSEHRSRGTPTFADTLPTPALSGCERSLGALPSAAAAGAPCS